MKTRTLTAALASGALALTLAACDSNGGDRERTTEPVDTTTSAAADPATSDAAEPTMDPTTDAATEDPTTDAATSEPATSEPTDGTATTDAAAGSEDVTQVSVFDVSVGMCGLESALSQTGTEWPEIDCALPHDLEIFALSDMTDASYPGEDATIEQAQSTCEGEFEGYVGTSYGASSLYYDAMYPSQESWDQGDREIVCILYTNDDSTWEGSAQGTGM